MKRNIVNFVIISQPRSGSTWLRLMLSKHPQVCCFGEVFGINKVIGLNFERYRRWGESSIAVRQRLFLQRSTNPMKFYRRDVLKNRWAVNQLVREVHPKQAVVGFKLLYHQLEYWKQVKRAIKKDQSLYIIHLIRENKLKQFISQKLHRKRGRKLIKADGPTPSYVKIRVDLEEFEIWSKSMIAQENRVNRWLSGKSFLYSLSYETLVSDKDHHLSQLQAFLKLTREELEESLQKVNSDNLRDMITNYHEVRGAFGHYF